MLKCTFYAKKIYTQVVQIYL